jgi:hypothetical protein
MRWRRNWCLLNLLRWRWWRLHWQMRLQLRQRPLHDLKPKAQRMNRLAELIGFVWSSHANSGSDDVKLC